MSHSVPRRRVRKQAKLPRGISREESRNARLQAQIIKEQMMDHLEVARKIVNVWGNMDRSILIPAIAAALDDAEREGMLKTAKWQESAITPKSVSVSKLPASEAHNPIIYS